MEKCWDDNSGFLDQFETRRRSFISNLYCYAVRGGRWGDMQTAPEATTVEEVLKRVKKGCDDRLASPWERDEMMQDCEQLRDLLDTDLSRQFAEHIIWRESLKGELKEKLKGDRTVQFQQKAMAAKPASDKQKAYVKALGFTGETEGMSMAEASKLIEKMKA